jgi:hypothetical protein
MAFSIAHIVHRRLIEIHLYLYLECAHDNREYIFYASPYSVVTFLALKHKGHYIRSQLPTRKNLIWELRVWRDPAWISLWETQNKGKAISVFKHEVWRLKEE